MDFQPNDLVVYQDGGNYSYCKDWLGRKGVFLGKRETYNDVRFQGEERVKTINPLNIKHDDGFKVGDRVRISQLNDRKGTIELVNGLEYCIKTDKECAGTPYPNCDKLHCCKIIEEHLIKIAPEDKKVAEEKKEKEEFKIGDRVKVTTGIKGTIEHFFGDGRLYGIRTDEEYTGTPYPNCDKKHCYVTHKENLTKIAPEGKNVVKEKKEKEEFQPNDLFIYQNGDNFSHCERWLGRKGVFLGKKLSWIEIRFQEKKHVEHINPANIKHDDDFKVGDRVRISEFRNIKGTIESISDNEHNIRTDEPFRGLKYTNCDKEHCCVVLSDSLIKITPKDKEVAEEKKEKEEFKIGDRVTLTFHGMTGTLERILKTSVGVNYCVKTDEEYAGTPYPKSFNPK